MQTIPTSTSSSRSSTREYVLRPYLVTNAWQRYEIGSQTATNRDAVNVDSAAAWASATFLRPMTAIPIDPECDSLRFVIFGPSHGSVTDSVALRLRSAEPRQGRARRVQTGRS